MVKKLSRIFDESIGDLLERVLYSIQEQRDTSCDQNQLSPWFAFGLVPQAPPGRPLGYAPQFRAHPDPDLSASRLVSGYPDLQAGKPVAVDLTHKFQEQECSAFESVGTLPKKLDFLPGLGW